MAERASFGLAYGLQSALGTPATAPYKLIPWSAFSPGITVNRLEDPTGLGTRMGAVGRSGTIAVAPVVTVPYRDTAFDDFLASMFQGAWVTNVLQQASTRTWITLEDRQPDAGAGFAGLYQDVVPNQLQLTLPANGLAEAQFTCLGTLYSDTSTPSASPTAASTAKPMDTLSGTFNYAGAAYRLTSLRLTMDNRGEARFVLGNRTPDRVLFNTDRVTGEFTAVFLGPARLDDARNDTSRALAFTLVNGAKSHAFSLPDVHTTGWNAPVSNDPERVETVQFEAGTGAGTYKVQITRA
jgi:hypothetical protein